MRASMNLCCDHNQHKTICYGKPKLSLLNPVLYFLSFVQSLYPLAGSSTLNISSLYSRRPVVHSQAFMAL